jgi:hypothetical protein
MKRLDVLVQRLVKLFEHLDVPATSGSTSEPSEVQIFLHGGFDDSDQVSQPLQIADELDATGMAALEDWKSRVKTGGAWKVA